MTKLHAIRTFVLSLAVVAGLAAPSLAQLASRPADEWIKALDSPARVPGLKITETVAALNLKPGQVVADIGAGSGTFTIPLAQALRPGGTAYAVDVDQKLIDHIAEKATEQGMANVRIVLGAFTDPDLPEQVDLAFISDVLHHIENRAEYLKNLAAYLKPGGRIAVVDFRPNQGGHRNQPSLQVTEEQTAAWMAAAGLKPIESIDLFTDKWFVIYGR
jgi:ubiquinone/menaquinone biosynthesis C-methylase UbiE